MTKQLSERKLNGQRIDSQIIPLDAYRAQSQPE